MWHKPFLGDSKFCVNVLYSLIIGMDGLSFLFARKDQRTFSVSKMEEVISLKRNWDI